jgi:hypothetical protein
MKSFVFTSIATLFKMSIFCSAEKNLELVDLIMFSEKFASSTKGKRFEMAFDDILKREKDN